MRFDKLEGRAPSRPILLGDGTETVPPIEKKRAGDLPARSRIFVNAKKNQLFFVIVLSHSDFSCAY